MLWVEILQIKSFEKFGGKCIAQHVPNSSLETSLEIDEPFDIYNLHKSSCYIKKGSQEGWVPSHKLKLTRQKVMIDEICEMDLKLCIREGDSEKIVKPTYTNIMGAHFGHQQEFKSQALAVGIFLGNEVIANLKLEPKSVQSFGNEEYLSEEIEVYAECLRVNYMTININFALNESAFASVRLTRTLQPFTSENNENYLLTTKAYTTMNRLSISGNLSITRFKVTFDTDSSVSTDPFTIYVQSIRLIKLTAKSLIVTTKDVRSFEIFSDDFKKIHEILQNILTNTLSLAIDCCSQFNSDLIYSGVESSSHILTQEFSRLKGENVRASYINADYKLCDSYPSVLYFPSQISDSVILKVAEFRSKERVPTITWCRGSVFLFRSSQPKVGLGKRSADDEQFFAKARIKYVIDARPGMNAKANRLKGKGYELEEFYKVKLKFMDIQNIHHVTRSLDSLNNLCSLKNNEFWLGIHESKWMNHVILILEASVCCANHLILEKSNVLVHCSDGWDRTSQISAITQLLIDPFYRTLEGFTRLIKKDWLAFGHKFFDRTFGHEFSPIFLLFLDCVSQIQEQFYEDFEFSKEYIIFLADASIRGLYGNFLCNTERERNDLLIRTLDVWTEKRREFINRSYCPGYYKILPLSVSAENLTIWKFLTRYS